MDRYDFIDLDTGHEHTPIPNMKDGKWMLTADVEMWMADLKTDNMDKTIEIDGVTFVPLISVTGLRHIVVLDRGWIFVGDLVMDLAHGSYTLTNCANVRKWSTGGFGGLCKDPKGSGVVLDPCADLRFAETAPLFTVPVEDDWGE